MAQIIDRNTVIVTQDELGTNCWMPIRFLNRCRECFRYERCKYHEKKADAVYDALLEEKRKLRKKKIMSSVRLKILAKSKKKNYRKKKEENSRNR